MCISDGSSDVCSSDLLAQAHLIEMAAADHDAVLADFAGDLGRRTRHRHECDRRCTRLCIAWPEQAYIVARGEKVEDRLHALRFAGVQERAHARCTAGDVTAALMEIEDRKRVV